MRAIGIGVIACLAMACGGRLPEGLGVREGRLAPCPESPNCVSSDAADPGHWIAPIRIEGSPRTAWQGMRALLVETPRVEIVREEGDYLHAVFTTRIMRYRDDVELHARPSRGEIALRSASRLGYGDMGTNRRRVEQLRAELVRRGLARPAESEEE
jgi:uncharacterized protein (DUF1499 family)